jgi:micrococcal nuclease
MYNYNANVVKVIDGDTVRLDIDLGFRVRWVSNCRLASINAPELGSGGEEARDYLKTILPENCKVEIVSRSLDKYGRPIVDIKSADGTVNQHLIDKKLVKLYK